MGNESAQSLSRRPLSEHTEIKENAVQKWEYRLIIFELPRAPGGSEGDMTIWDTDLPEGKTKVKVKVDGVALNSTQVQYLNQLGEGGWQVVSSDVSRGHYFLQRPKS